jgi:hypothetical protein
VQAGNSFGGVTEKFRLTARSRTVKASAVKAKASGTDAVITLIAPYGWGSVTIQDNGCFFYFVNKKLEIRPINIIFVCKDLIPAAPGKKEKALSGTDAGQG